MKGEENYDAEHKIVIVILQILGEKGTEFEKHLMEYSNSGGVYDMQYIPVVDYYVLEDGEVLMQYADGHSERHSLEEKRIVKEFSEKTSKYSLKCIGDF